MKQVLLLAVVLGFGSALLGQEREFIRGDCDGDGAVTEKDAGIIPDFLFSREPPEVPVCLDALDANDDGRITLEDALYLTLFTLDGGPPPPEPFPKPGADSTSDPITCEKAAPLEAEPTGRYTFELERMGVAPGAEEIALGLSVRFWHAARPPEGFSVAIHCPSDLLSVKDVVPSVEGGPPFDFFFWKADPVSGEILIAAQAPRGMPVPVDKDMGPRTLLHLVLRAEKLEPGARVELPVLPWAGDPPVYTGVTVGGAFLPCEGKPGAVEAMPVGEFFVRGDIDGDGSVSLSDLEYLLKWLRDRGEPPPCFDAADLDDDGVITGRDLRLLRSVIDGSAHVRIPPPFPEPGPDPTEDTIRCGEYTPPPDVGPMEPLVLIVAEGAAGLPGERVRVPVSIYNRVPVRELTLLVRWDPNVLYLEGVSREEKGVIAEIRKAPFFDSRVELEKGWVSLEIECEEESPVPPLVKPGERRGKRAAAYLVFTILEPAEAPSDLPVGLPLRICPPEEASCLYTSAVLEGGRVIRPRTVPGSVAVMARAEDGGVEIVQQVTAAVDGEAGEPMGEVKAVAKYDSKTGEGTIEFPDLPLPEGKKGRTKDGGLFPYCFFPAQVGSAILRAISLVHGAAMPGSANLASLTDADSILLQIEEYYPIQDPKKKGFPYNSLGYSKILLEMDTDYPRVQMMQIDVAGLNWKSLVCPPAPFTYEWSLVGEKSSLLAVFEGDYCLGWDEQTAAGSKKRFYNYKHVITKCVPLGDEFSEIPDQISLVGVEHDPETGGARFVCFLVHDEGNEFTRGDANGDGELDIGDAVFIISYLFRGGEPSSPPDSSDVNDDGRVDISDAIRILSYLFRDTNSDMIDAPYWEMAPYKGLKGLDPTPDDL